MEHANQLIKRIVDEYKAMGEDVGRDKFRSIKSAIIASLDKTAEGDRFPPIRALGKALEVTPVSVQKAVTELIAENRLYSKGRLGVFVRTPTASISPNAGIPQKTHFDILFNERSDHIHKMMVSVLTSLRDQLPRLDIGLFYDPEAKDSFDLYMQNELPPGISPLNLANSVSHEIERGNMTLSTSFVAPLANQTYYFVWNRNLLKRKKVSEPAYRTFVEQREYFAELNQHFDIPVLSWLRPDHLLGKRAAQIINVLKSGCSLGDPEAVDVKHLVTEVLEFCELWEYEKTNFAVNNFIQGERPGIVFPTTSLFDLRKRIKNFELGYYPTLGHDDALILLPTPIKIPARYDIFYEGIQILKVLQSRKIQLIYQEEGYITIHGEGKYLPKHLLQASRNASIILGGDDRDSYLRHTIIALEMLMTGVYEKEYQTALDNIFHYAQAILTQTPERNPSR